MAENRIARILVCAQEINAFAEARHLLIADGYEVFGHLLGSPDPDRMDDYDFVLVDGTVNGAEALALCRRLSARLEHEFVPLVFVINDRDPAARLDGFHAGADACLLRPFAPGELLAQVRALSRIQAMHSRLTERTEELHRVNQRLRHAYQQMDQELELAQRIQVSFLPQTLPQVPMARFAARYVPNGRVGGDFYDVIRLDEHHVGLYVADAMGHGVPASLLTIFVKKGIRAKDVFGQQYRIITPGEVLQRLNQDLIDQKLSENPFITMVYLLLNHKEGILQFARAGHPYPVYVPANGEVRAWQHDGLLLGVVNATYTMETHRLHPGDKVLLYSDGIDSAIFEGNPAGTASLLACADRHRAESIGPFVDNVARDLIGGTAHPDDVTFLGLEITG